MKLKVKEAVEKVKQLSDERTELHRELETLKSLLADGHNEEKKKLPRVAEQLGPCSLYVDEIPDPPPDMGGGIDKDIDIPQMPQQGSPQQPQYVPLLAELKEAQKAMGLTIAPTTGRPEQDQEGLHCLAKYPFTPRQGKIRELEVPRGAHVLVFEVTANGWATCRVLAPPQNARPESLALDGRVGVVPASYLMVCNEDGSLDRRDDTALVGLPPPAGQYGAYSYEYLLARVVRARESITPEQQAEMGNGGEGVAVEEGHLYATVPGTAPAGCLRVREILSGNTGTAPATAFAATRIVSTPELAWSLRASVRGGLFVLLDAARGKRPLIRVVQVAPDGGSLLVSKPGGKPGLVVPMCDVSGVTVSLADPLVLEIQTAPSSASGPLLLANKSARDCEAWAKCFAVIVASMSNTDSESGGE